MNFCQEWVDAFVRLLVRGKDWPLGQAAPLPKPKLPADAPKALIFSPHPDDEVIIGGLPLRLQRELRIRVINVAVTQGSHPARQAERFQELHRCCDHLGFELVQTAPNGLEGINLRTRQSQPQTWAASVDCIAQILREHQPRIIFFPHQQDWNSTHVGTHHLVIEALTRLGPEFTCQMAETEFWGAMDNPNLMVESSATDLVDLLNALTFHVGEVQRNPYHLRLPAWMIDNVRRGGELVGGQGNAAPDFFFATLYRLRRWRGGQPERIFEGGRMLSQEADLAPLFGRWTDESPQRHSIA